MISDSIINDVRTIRREILESYDWDVKKYLRALEQDERFSNRSVITPPPRPEPKATILPTSDHKER
jgi:hypothetical protein